MWKVLLFFAALASLVGNVHMIGSDDYDVEIDGYVHCNGAALYGKTVHVEEQDTRLDDLGFVVTKHDGSFKYTRKESEWGSFDPYIRLKGISDSCNGKFNIGSFSDSATIKKNYIFDACKCVKDAEVNADQAKTGGVFEEY